MQKTVSTNNVAVCMSVKQKKKKSDNSNESSFRSKLKNPDQNPMKKFWYTGASSMKNLAIIFDIQH